MKKSLTKIIACVMATILVGGAFAACSNGGAGSEKLKIGVIQLLEHDALDAAYEGFKKQLDELGYSEAKGNVQYVYENAQNEQANCNTIADKLLAEKCDLILAIATPAAQAVAEKIKNIPILATCVTDLKDAGLVTENDAPGGNVSGTSDLNPITEQIDLLTQFVPTAKNIGIFYCSNEDNSKFQAALAKEAIEKKGMTSQDFTVTAATEIQSVVESMTGKVDAIYIGTDNLLANGMPTVSDVANRLGIPAIVGEKGMVVNGGLATYGISYDELGKQTGKMAYEILINKADISTMAVQYQSADKLEVAVNSNTADALKLSIPESVKEKALIIPEKAQ